MTAGRPGSDELHRVQPGDHLLLAYEDLEEVTATVGPLFASGARARRLSVYVSAGSPREAVAGRLAAAGLEVGELLAAGGLMILDAADLVAPGQFSSPAMITQLRETVDQARGAGFDGVQLAVEAAFVHQARVPVETFLEHEHRVNEDFFEETGAVVVCAYDRAHFSDSAVERAIEAHPRVLSGGWVCDNLFYEPPATAVGPGRLDRRLRALRQCRRASLYEAPALAGPALARPLKILVVDDDRDSATLLAEIVELEGHQSRIAFDGPPALEVAADWQPDAVLLDIGLPAMSGYEVARRLRRLLPTGAAVFAITGFGGEEEAGWARDAGCDRHLVKPVSVPLLRRLLDEFRGGR